ncbi:thioesterase family protein [Tistrella mobilis]|uniref:acyl-CoA thioesterase n=1 Tax=Tistrella mobilis TaxID=171437 RepID=UPI003556977A
MTTSETLPPYTADDLLIDTVPPPTDPAAIGPGAGRFRLWIPERIRFGETDMLGHVNNAVYARWLELGRTRLFDLCGLATRYDQDAPTVMVQAELRIGYKAELRYPGLVMIATGVQRIGRSSIAIPQALYAGGVLIADSDSICVAIDRDTRRPAEVPADLRRALERYATREPAVG